MTQKQTVNCRKCKRACNIVKKKLSYWKGQEPMLISLFICRKCNTIYAFKTFEEVNWI